MKEELLKGLTQEQIEKAKACKSQDELLALAKEEGITLTDEQLEAVSGGFCTSTPSFTCPKCGSTNIESEHRNNHIRKYWANTCKDCKYYWSV